MLTAVYERQPGGVVTNLDEAARRRYELRLNGTERIEGDDGAGITRLQRYSLRILTSKPANIMMTR